MALHKDLTGADLHEPKGVAGAAAETLYHSDGVGSGTWKKASALQVTLEDSQENFSATNVEAALHELWQTVVVVGGVFSDVSNPSTILLPVPFSCTVESIKMVLGGPITSSNSVVTVTRSDGAAMGTQTIAFSGSAEGSVFNFTPTGNTDLELPTHNYVKLVSDGASSTTAILYVQMLIRRT